MATSKITVDKRGVNPNLLDNWYFVGGGSQSNGNTFPINHRGQTIYAGAGVYAIDRWALDQNGVSNVQISASGMTLAGSSTVGGYIKQIVEAEALKGQKITYSVLYESGGTVRLATGTGTVPTEFSSNVTITNALNNQIPNGAGCGVYVNGGNVFAQMGQTASHSIKLLAAKLELGDTQTLAHLANGAWVLNEVPNYEEQLIRCVLSKANGSDNYSKGRPAAGFIASSGIPYLRFLGDDSCIYQWTVIGAGTTQSPYKLAIQKYDGTSWSNFMTFTAD